MLLVWFGLTSVLMAGMSWISLGKREWAAALAWAMAAGAVAMVVAQRWGAL